MKRPKITSLTPESPDGSAIQLGVAAAENAFDGTSIDVLESLDKLEERQRECLVLQHWYGFTHQDIASLMGVSTKTVHRMTNLAFIQLNELLKSYRPTEHPGKYDDAASGLETALMHRRSMAWIRHSSRMEKGIALARSSPKIKCVNQRRWQSAEGTSFTFDVYFSVRHDRSISRSEQVLQSPFVAYAINSYKALARLSSVPIG